VKKIEDGRFLMPIEGDSQPALEEARAVAGD
jgi:hypothetical protein